MNLSEKTAKRMLTDIKEIRKKVLEAIAESTQRLTPGELEKRLSHEFNIGKKALRTAVRELLADQEIVYTYHFGTSFLEKSFNKPTRISKRIVLKPPGSYYRSLSGDVVVELCQGVSFGSGEHPTTRLAARGIETVLSGNRFFKKNSDIRVLDIGTGSGVLAIVAVALGAKGAVGIDIDPCAISEAGENVKINRLKDRIEIDALDIENITNRFSLITANLRYPTLKRLRGRLAEITEKTGAVVVSGVKTDEVTDLVELYAEEGFRCRWKAFEKNWAGVVFVR